MDTEKLLTVKEAAEILRSCPSKVYEWTKNGKIEHLRLGITGKVLIPESKLHEFIRRATVKTTSVRHGKP